MVKESKTSDGWIGSRSRSEIIEDLRNVLSSDNSGIYSGLRATLDVFNNSYDSRNVQGGNSQSIRPNAIDRTLDSDVKKYALIDSYTSVNSSPRKDFGNPIPVKSWYEI